MQKLYKIIYAFLVALLVLIIGALPVCALFSNSSYLHVGNAGSYFTVGFSDNSYMETGFGVISVPTNVSATDGTHTDKVVITWTKVAGATGYRVYRDSVDISGLLGDVATYDDVGAGTPSITSGTASATKGTSPTYVRLLISGEGPVNGTTHSYEVVSVTGGVDSSHSSADTGYRGIGTLAYQWQRSAADSDGAYVSIAGGTTEPYNDLGGVTTPDGRYYRCVMTAAGASNVTTPADRGYMAGATPDDTASAQGKTIMRDMLPLAVVAGILVGVITAVRSGKRSLGEMLSRVMIGVIAFVLLWAMLQALM